MVRFCKQNYWPSWWTQQLERNILASACLNAIKCHTTCRKQMGDDTMCEFVVECKFKTSWGLVQFLDYLVTYKISSFIARDLILPPPLINTNFILPSPLRSSEWPLAFRTSKWSCVFSFLCIINSVTIWFSVISLTLMKLREGYKL